MAYSRMSALIFSTMSLSDSFLISDWPLHNLLKTLQFKLVIIFLICNFNLKLYKIVWITSELAYLVCYSLAFIHLPQSQNSETCNFLKPSCSKHSGSFDLKLSKKHVVFLTCQSLKLVKLVSIASIYITFVYAISI